MGAVDRLPRLLALPLGLGLLGLATFAIWHSLPPQVPDPQPSINGPRVTRSLPVPGDQAEMERLRTTGAALQSLQPGMRRVEVEAAIGRPDPKVISAVERIADRAIYRTRHPAFVSEPLWFAPDVRGLCEAILEYDATRPGHPLVRLSCTTVPGPPPPAAVTTNGVTM